LCAIIFNLLFIRIILFCFFPLVILPPNVYSGDTLHVQTPNGQIQSVTVPLGISPGGRFMVRIASEVSTTTALPTPVIATNGSYIGNTSSTISTNPSAQTAINSTTNQFQPNIHVPSYTNSATTNSNPQPQVYTSGMTNTAQVYVPTVYTRT